MITLAIVIAVTVVMVVFSVQNAAPVTVAFLSWKFESSLAVILLLALLVGILIGGVSVWLWRFKRPAHGGKPPFPGPRDPGPRT